jgi:predicted membrane protein
MKAQNSYEPQRDTQQRLVPAIVLIAVGAIFFLNNLHILAWHEIWAYWPVALIAAGLYKVVDTDEASHRIVLLIGLGLMLLFERAGWLWTGHRSWNATTASSANVLFESAVFGGGKRRIVVSDFRGGKVDAVFGGFEIDLRNCDIAGDSAVLELNAVFGGVELRIPENWSVVCKGAGVFGGYSDETHHPTPGQFPNFKQLICKGGAVFGGVVIKN